MFTCYTYMMGVTKLLEPDKNWPSFSDDVLSKIDSHHRNMKVIISELNLKRTELSFLTMFMKLSIAGLDKWPTFCRGQFQIRFFSHQCVDKPLPTNDFCHHWHITAWQEAKVLMCAYSHSGAWMVAESLRSDATRLLLLNISSGGWRARLGQYL